MWKEIILSVLLSVVQGVIPNDIYGNYTFVLLYPNDIVTAPACGGISFSEDPRKVECNCSDGRNCTLVKIRLVEYERPVPPIIVNTNPVALSVPVLVVDNVGDLALVNVTCSYAEAFNDRSIIEVVNKNYLLGYVSNKNKVMVFLMARELPSSSELEHDITYIDKLKDKDWSRLCTRELFDQLHTKT